MNYRLQCHSDRMNTSRHPQHISRRCPWPQTTVLIICCRGGRQCLASITGMVMATAVSRRLGKSRHADSSTVGITRSEHRWLDYALLRANNSATWWLSTAICNLLSLRLLPIPRKEVGIITGSCLYVLCKSPQNLICVTNFLGARGGAVGWGTALQVGRSWVRFPMVSLEFFIDIILLAALWPWGWLSLWKKWVPGIFPGW